MSCQPQRSSRPDASQWKRRLGRMSVLTCLAMMSTVAWSQELKDAGAAAVKLNAPEGQKWALLVGVDQYLDKRLGSLQYCGADAQALRDVLVRQGGFPADQVMVLHDKQAEPIRQPLRLSIEQSLKALLAQAGPKDLILVSFSGHGIQMGETAYLCPTEADLDKPEATMVSVAGLYDKLSKDCRAAQKIVFIDACRKPVATGQKAPSLELTKGFSDRLRQVPEGLLILSSCKAGQLSYEEKDFGHGVFAHFLLDGLTGKADARGPNLRGNGDGRIEVDELFNYASTQTGKYVMNKFVEAQTPELYGVRRGPIDLLAALPDVREILDKALRVAESISDKNRSITVIKMRLPATSIVLSKVGEAHAQAGDKRAARLAFENAIRSARLISDDDMSLRAGMLAWIALSQAKTADFSAAMETARSIGDESVINSTSQYQEDDLRNPFYNKSTIEFPFDSLHREMDDWNSSPSNKMSALTQVALLQAEHSEVQAAQSTLKQALDASRLIKDNSSRASALTFIALAQAKCGDNQEARVTLRDAVRVGRWIHNADGVMSNSRSATLSDIALAQSRVGDVDAARATTQESLQAARSMKDEHQSISAMRQIALVQVKNADFDGSQATLHEALAKARSMSNHYGKVPALGEIAFAQALAGDKKAARLTIDDALREIRANKDASGISYYPCEIVKAQLEVSGVAEALQTAKSMSEKPSQVSALICIADAQVKSGDFIGALNTARAINLLDRDRGVECIAGIAIAQAGVGDSISAQATSRDLLAIADELLKKRSVNDSTTTNGDSVFWASSYIALAQAKSGLGHEALETVRDFMIPHWNEEDGWFLAYAPVVLSFCRDQLKNGYATQVCELAERIPNPIDRIAVLLCLAEAIREEQKHAVPTK